MTDDKLTIEALRVLTDLGGFKPDGEYVRPGTRFATTDDIIAVLEGLGAERFSTPRPTSGPWLEPGTYLVWRIE